MPRERLLHAVVFSALISAQFFLRALPAVADDPVVAVGLLAYLLARNLCFVVPFLAFVAMVQSRVPAGRQRLPWLAGGIMLLVALNAAFALWATVGQYTIAHGLATHEGLALENAWTFATFGCLVVWYYESADRAARAIRSLHRHQLACRSAERWVAEMRLGVLQARIDPRLLRDTLDRASRQYEVGVAAGDAVIADLIDYLRKALPPLRIAESTVEREVALALAFGRLLRGRDDPDCVIRAFVAPEVANARFPPMVMQPLCEALLRGSPAASLVTLDATRCNGDACVAASASPCSFSAERIEAARLAVAPRFESHAGLTVVENRDGVRRVVLRVPYVASPPVAHIANLERRMSWSPNARMEPAS